MTGQAQMLPSRNARMPSQIPRSGPVSTVHSRLSHSCWGSPRPRYRYMFATPTGNSAGALRSTGGRQTLSAAGPAGTTIEAGLPCSPSCHRCPSRQSFLQVAISEMGLTLAMIGGRCPVPPDNADYDSDEGSPVTSMPRGCQAVFWIFSRCDRRQWSSGFSGWNWVLHLNSDLDDQSPPTTLTTKRPSRAWSITTSETLTERCKRLFR
jgi:hypothetical protein